MESKTLLCLAFVVSTWFSMAASLTGSGLPCVQKLLPCEPYLHATSPPPPTCCLPLKELISGDAQCLCAIFNNEALLKSFNVTKDEALKLPKACGANADLSLCNNGTAAAPAPGSPIVSPPPAPPAKGANTTASVSPRDAAVGVVAALMAGCTSMAALLF